MAQTTEIYPHIDSARAQKIVTFTGAAGLGAIGTVSLFTVTGEVEVISMVPVCTTNLAGATATIALGVTGSTSLFLAATTATDLVANDWWIDTSPTEVAGIAIPAALKNIAVRADIIATIATAAISGGVLEFSVVWRPLSSDGLLVAA